MTVTNTRDTMSTVVLRSQPPGDLDEACEEVVLLRPRDSLKAFWYIIFTTATRLFTERNVFLCAIVSDEKEKQKISAPTVTRFAEKLWRKSEMFSSALSLWWRRERKLSRVLFLLLLQDGFSFVPCFPFSRKSEEMENLPVALSSLEKLFTFVILKFLPSPSLVTRHQHQLMTRLPCRGQRRNIRTCHYPKEFFRLPSHQKGFQRAAQSPAFSPNASWAARSVHIQREIVENRNLGKNTVNLLHPISGRFMDFHTFSF